VHSLEIDPWNLFNTEEGQEEGEKIGGGGGGGGEEER
jgi:hypothetical protein